MIGRTNTGGGGGWLNIRINTYSSESDLLASSPKENTIGVVTSEKVTGYAFTASEPSEPYVGLLWVTIGTNSPGAINILKKNEIMIYPMSAKQYLSGAWVTVPAKTFSGGAWVDWLTYLYNTGDLCTDLTGGWIVEPLPYTSGGSSASGKGAQITATSPRLAIESSTAAYGAIVRTSKKIKMAGFDTLTFVGDMTEAPSDHVYFFGFGVWSEIGSYAKQNLVASVEFKEADQYWNMKSVSLDVSSISDNCYVGFFINTNVKIYVDTMYLK